MKGFCGDAGTPVIGLAVEVLPANADGPAGPAGLSTAPASAGAAKPMPSASAAIVVRRSGGLVSSPDTVMLSWFKRRRGCLRTLAGGRPGGHPPEVTDARAVWRYAASRAVISARARCVSRSCRL